MELRDFKALKITIFSISFYGTSTFSQYTVLPEICVAKISKESPLDKVWLFGDGITTGYGAVINTLKVEEGATVMVVGLGGVGLAAIMGAYQVGASKIIGVDINTDKFKKAEEFGWTELINPADHKGKDLYEIIFEITDGIGVDYSIECVGTPHTMKQAFLSTKPNGGCSCIIGVAAAGQMIELNTEDIEGREWIGTTFGGAKSRDDIPELVEKYLNKEIKVDEFITHNFDLKDINRAFHVMHEGTCIKAIIKMFEDE